MMSQNNIDENNEITRTSMIGADHPERERGLIPLTTAGAFQRWCQQRMAVYSNAKESFMLASLLLLGFLGGPALVFFCMSWLLHGSLGTSGGGAAALAFNGALYLLLLLLLSVLGCVIFNNMRKPTHLLIDDQGLQFHYHTAIGKFRGRRCPWNKIDRMEIFKPGNTINSNRYVLRCLEDSTKVFDLPLSWLDNLKSRDKLASAVKEHLPDVQRDLEVAVYLQPPLGDTFTQIWFLSLAGSQYIEGLNSSAGRIDNANEIIGHQIETNK